jgi:AmiR/NasT family two-component response regulator
MTDQALHHHSRAASADGRQRASSAQPRATRHSGAGHADLRQATVLIAHPKDPQGTTLMQTVRRVVSAVEVVWPVPVLPPLGFDYAIVALDSDMLLSAPWLSGAPPLPIVAVFDGEKGIAPEVLRLSNVQAIVATPCQPAAIAANLTLARSVFSYERRMQNKLAKLEETLHASRQIEQAKLIVMQQRKLRANEAYDYLRRQAMTKQMSVAAISAALVDAYGLID